MCMNTYLYLHVCMFLSTVVALLIMCSRSFLSTEWKARVQLKVFFIGRFYGHVMTICLSSLEKLPFFFFFLKAFIALYNQVKKAQ